VRDEDFDRRQSDRALAGDLDVDRPRIPGRETLVEAELHGRRGTPNGPGKQTLVEATERDHGNGNAQTSGVVETEFQISKVREVLSKLAGNPSPVQLRVLRADLRLHLNAATNAAGQAGGHPRWHALATSLFQLVAESQRWLQAPNGAATPQPAPREASDNDPTAIAAQGVEGHGEALPHRDEVQRLMGHDLSHVRAYVGGNAAEASGKLGAHAYALGDKIAFAASPSVELVAHEATHIVQQRAGVSAKGIDGGAGDAHEQQADEVASVVARGESAAPLLAGLRSSGTNGTSAVQRKSSANAPQARAAASGALVTKTQEPVQGIEVARAQIDAAAVAHVPGLRIEATARVEARLVVAGDRLAIDLAVGSDHWTASVTAAQVVEALVGPDGAKELGDAVQFLQRLPQLAKLTGNRLRLDLWGKGPDQSFAVLDLDRLIAGLGRGSYEGLRPVEAQILLGKAGGVRVFGDDQVRANDAIPGEPLGGWFELPPDERLASALGVEASKAGSIVGGAFYEGGVLRVAVKPNAEAKTGIVAHVDVLYLLEKAKSLGKRGLEWVEKVAARIKAGAVDFVKMLAGKLHFELPELPGTFFDFDLNLQLPRLFRGGHFDWASLLPTGFHLDLGGFSLGALPRLRFPWLATPSLGGFHVPWDRIRGMLGTLSVPKLPDFELSLHLSGSLSFGLGVDLGKLMPDLGDLAIGFEIHVEKLLAKIERAGHWLLGKMRSTKDWVQRYVHLGGDGVLRFYDKQDPSGAMVGFHLLRLLDGADATDLAPTEMRYGGTGTASLEMGEEAEKTDDSKQPAGKATPHRPDGKVVTSKAIAAPDRLAEVMALAPKAPVDVELIHHGDQLTLWAHTKSTVYAHEQALRMDVNIHAVAAALTQQIDQLRKMHISAGDLAIALDEELSKDGPYFKLGKLAVPSKVGIGGKAGKLSGFAEWKIEDMLGAHDWTGLAPSKAQVDVEGIAGAQYGELAPQGELLTQVDFTSQQLRDGLFHDGGGDLHAAIYKAPDLLSLAVAKDPQMHVGVLASVHPSALLQGLRKLGDIGTRALQWVAEQLHLGAGKTDVWSKLDQLATALFRYLKKAANGILEIQLPNFKLSWDLNLQLPHLGVNLDLGALIPDLDFKLPKLPELAFRFGHGKGFPDFGFRLPHLGGLLAGLPHLKLPHGLDVHFHLDELRIGLSLALGDLFGDGDRVLQFDLPLEKLLSKLRSMGHWVSQRVQQLDFKLGADGVLRVFAKGKPTGTRTGFDLKKLFEGIDIEDLVPVEVFADVEVKGHDVAEVAMGDDSSQPKGKEDPVGKVRVPRPNGHPALSTAVAAPAWLKSQLGLKDNALVHASLYLDNDAKRNDAVLFASADGSDRGIEIRVHAGELASLVGALGPVKTEGTLEIDIRATVAKGMLVVSFGKDKSAALHGHAGWRLSSLLADPSLSSLVPDEVVAERKEGKLELSNAIDLSGLKQRGNPIPLTGLDWAKHALGSDEAFVFAAHDLRANPRIALASAPHKDGTHSGVELTLDKQMVAGLEMRAHELADKTAAAAAAAFKHGKEESRSAWKVRATDRGLTVERGPESQPDHIYASYGWHHLAAIVGGDSTSLLPDDMRVGTKTMALEMHALGKPPEKPGKAHEIDTLPSILRTPLEAIGLAPKQMIEFHADRSRMEDPAKQRIRAVATVWNQEGGELTDGREIELTVDLEALLAHLVPHHRKWAKKEDVKKGGKSHVTAALDVSADGVEMEAGMSYDTASGKHRELDIKVGWTLDQIIDILTSLQEGKDGSLQLGAGQLVPERIEGSFATDRFQVTFSKGKGGGSKYSCLVNDVPGLSGLLGAVLDPSTLAQATLNLNLPSTDDLKSQLKQAVATGKAFVPLVGCALGVPVAGSKDQTFYGITFAVAPSAFRKLLYLIPAAGEILKAIDTILDVVSDPIGTAEAVANTPEALLDMVEAAPEVYGNIKKMGFKKLAMGLMLGSHPSVRQFVLASRIKKKLEAAGWKPGMPKQKDWDNIPTEYLDWVSHQDAEALMLGQELDQLAKQSGIAIEPDYTHHGAELLPADVQAEIDNIEHGFKDLEEAREAEKSAPELVRPALEKRTKEQADKFGAHLKQVLASGVRAPEASADAESAAHTTKAANVDDAAVNKIDQLQPNAKQMQEAMSLFQDTKQNAKILASAEAQAWIQSFAGLSQDQLAELLMSGKTIATTPTGKVQLQVHGETQKTFVRMLYVKRMAAEGVVLHKTDGAASDDAKLVAAQQAHAAQAENDAERRTAAEDEARSGKGADEDEADDFDDDVDANAKGDGKGTGKGAAAGDASSATGAAKPSKGGDASKADDNASDGKLTLDEAFHIPANRIFDFVILKPDGSLEVAQDSKVKAGNRYRFNDEWVVLDRPPEIKNIRRAGAGKDRVTFFTFSLHFAGKDPVEHDYVIHGSRVSEGKHFDETDMAAGFARALTFDGTTWQVATTSTFDAGLVTLRVNQVVSSDEQSLVVEVQFVAIRTPDGHAEVTTADGTQKLVTATELARLRIHPPKRPPPRGKPS
jgi:hypothetical protein